MSISARSPWNRRGPVVVAALAWLAAGAAARGGSGAPAGAAVGGVEERLRAAGVELPAAPVPVANYVPAVREGDLIFLSGHGPLRADGSYVTGKVGRELTVEEGYQAARLTAIALLASLKAEIGDLDRVSRIVKVLGLVNADPSFTDHPKVINGCSDLIVQAFGERGRHARSALGAGSLPSGIAVEIEMIVAVGDAP